MARLNLKVHSTGYDATFEVLNMKTAWMRVDPPLRNKPGTKLANVIFGNPQATNDAADESAAQAVLEYYSQSRDINIDDFSHSALKKKQEDLSAANFFCSAMQDKVAQLVLERDAARAMLQNNSDCKNVKMEDFSESFLRKNQEQLNADFFYETLQEKIAELLQDRSAEKRRSTNMLHQVANLCAEFTDVLPLKMVSCDQSIGGDEHTGFIFHGDKANPSCVDKLAMALLKILDDGVIHEAKHGSSPY